MRICLKVWHGNNNGDYEDDNDNDNDDDDDNNDDNDDDDNNNEVDNTPHNLRRDCYPGYARVYSGVLDYAQV